MNDWQKDLWNSWDELTAEMQTIAEEVSREALNQGRVLTADLVDHWVSLSDEFMMDMRSTFTNESLQANPIDEFLDLDLEEFLNSLLRPFVDFSMQDFESPSPIDRPHPLCANCQNYHGQRYGGNLLVCGMHPYGLGEDQTTCEDHCGDL